MEIMFILNVYMRALFGERAQITSNSNFSLCHAHNLELLLSTDEEAAA